MARLGHIRYPSHLHQGGVVLLLLALLLPSQLVAQGHALRVTLHAVSGNAIAGVTISVWAEDGRELARALTGSDGAAHFTDLPAVVRVAVAGHPRGGPSLYQLGDDAQGIRIVLDTGDEPTVLNLRAEPDGLVLPDPATMLTLEEGGPIVVETTPIPTAAIATPAPLPTSQPTTIPSGVPGTGSEAPPRAGWVPLITVLIVVVAAGLMALIQRRRSAL